MGEQWKVGDYAMRHGTPVKIVGIGDNGLPNRLELVSNYEQGVGICCGGGVMGGSLAVTPIVEVDMFVLVEAYKAIKGIEAARQEIFRLEKVRDANIAALAALKSARDAARAQLPEATP